MRTTGREGGMNSFMWMSRCVFLLALVLSATAGCYQWKQVPGGVLETEGVTIRAIDGSFTITSGERFSTPDSAREFLSNSDRWGNEICRARSIGSKYRVALDMLKATRVYIDYPGFDKPLYGVLAFCPFHPYYEGEDYPAWRSHRIIVPKDKVDATTAGRISAVWENAVEGEDPRVTWILWISREPFPD